MAWNINSYEDELLSYIILAAQLHTHIPLCLYLFL